MSIRLIAAAVILSLSSAAGLAAKTVTFDFAAADSGAWAKNLTYMSGGLGLTVSGVDTTGMRGRVATEKGTGLGMRSATDCRPLGICTGPDALIDATGRQDIVGLLFSQAVRVTGIRFSYVDPFDTFNLWLGGAVQGQYAVSPFVALTSAWGTDFGIGAGRSSRKVCNPPHVKLGGPVCRTLWDFSSFRLSAVTVETASAVPLPAAAPLLIAGLGALVALRRKKRGAIPGTISARC
jgi:hypothetical protein